MIDVRVFIDAEMNGEKIQIELGPDKKKTGNILVGLYSIKLEDIREALKHHDIELQVDTISY